VLRCLSLGFVVSQIFFWDHASWSHKGEILRTSSSTFYICAWLSRCGSFGIASVPQTYARLTIVVFYPLASLARPVSSSSFKHSSWYSATRGRLESKILFDADPVGSPDFRIFSFFEDENWQEVFLPFCPDIKIIWPERKLTCNETTRPRVFLVHKFKYHTAIHLTHNN